MCIEWILNYGVSATKTYVRAVSYRVNKARVYSGLSALLTRGQSLESAQYQKDEMIGASLQQIGHQTRDRHKGKGRGEIFCVQGRNKRPSYTSNIGPPTHTHTHTHTHINLIKPTCTDFGRLWI